MSRRQYEKDNRSGHELPYDDMIRREALDARWSLAYGGPSSRSDEINQPPDPPKGRPGRKEHFDAAGRMVAITWDRPTWAASEF